MLSLAEILMKLQLFLIGISIIFGILILIATIVLNIITADWHSKKRMRIVRKYKSFDQIQIIEEKLNENHHILITTDEINSFLTEAAKQFSDSLLAIKKIILRERSSQFADNVNGAYESYRTTRSNQGATIYIFPYEKDSDKYRLYMNLAPNNDEDQPNLDKQNDEMYYVLLTKEQAKAQQLFTLAHEIGHNMIYNSEGRLFGDDIENAADEWAVKLGAISIVDEREFFANSIIYQNGKALGIFKDVYQEMIINRRAG